MESLEKNLKTFVARCRAAGLKATHQRVEIYRELLCCQSHPGAEAIWGKVRKRIPSISLDTVYRTLRSLAEMGLISRVHTPEGRLRYDANLSRHHHFVCEKCGAVRDFRCGDFDALSAPPAIGEFGVAASISVEVLGVCHQCGRKAGSRERAGKKNRKVGVTHGTRLGRKEAADEKAR